jgi:hypothetical protein
MVTCCLDWRHIFAFLCAEFDRFDDWGGYLRVRMLRLRQSYPFMLICFKLSLGNPRYFGAFLRL